MKPFDRITAFFLALLMLLCTLCSCTGALDPLGYLKDSVERTVKDSLAGQILDVFLGALEDGSVAVDFGGTDLLRGLPDAAKLKMWFNADNERVAADASLTLAGERFDAQAFLSETEAVVISPTFLGSNTLGVDFTTLQNDLKTSIFSNNSGTVFSHPEISSQLAERVKTVKDESFALLAASDDALDTADEILEFFLEALTTYATHMRYKEDGRTYITLEINNDSLSRALRATHEMVADDRSVSKFLVKIATAMDRILSAVTGVSDADYAARMNYFLNSEADIDEICLAVDEADPFMLSLKAGIRSFGMKLETLHVTFTQNYEKRLEADLMLAEKDDVSVLSVELDGVLHKLGYQVTEDTYRAFSAKLSYQRVGLEGEELMLTGDLKANKKERTYELSVSKGETSYAFAGSYLFETDETMLSVDSAAVNGERKKLSLKLHLNADEKPPAVPDYINVVKMDVTRFTPIYNRAMGVCVQVSRALANSGVLAWILPEGGFAWMGEFPA